MLHENEEELLCKVSAISGENNGSWLLVGTLAMVCLTELNLGGGLNCF